MTEFERDNDKPESLADTADESRRRLLRAAALSGIGLTLGQIPYQTPAIKSFFGTRAAWAQATGPNCSVISVRAPAASSTGLTAGFEVSNNGTAPFDLVQIDSSNPDFAVTKPASLFPRAAEYSAEVTTRRI